MYQSLYLKSPSMLQFINLIKSVNNQMTFSLHCALGQYEFDLEQCRLLWQEVL